MTDRLSDGRLLFVPLETVAQDRLLAAWNDAADWDPLTPAVLAEKLEAEPPEARAVGRAAIVEGVVDGTLDVIASDHAPHTEAEKEVEFDFAPFGIVGLETELSLSLMQFHHTGRLPLGALLAKLTCNPARLLRLDGGRGTLAVGGVADVTVLDLDARWTCDRHETASKSRNNPFHGWHMKGRATHTIVRGKVVWTLGP
jgi:dihydroorotase